MDQTELHESRIIRGRDSKAVRIARTRLGKAVFAGRRFEAEAIVGEIEGEVIDDPEYGSEYCMDIGDGCVIEPASPFRYVNHNCDPNCRFDWYDVTDKGESQPRKRVFLIASHDIFPGEELTISYNWSAEAAIRCRCHSPSCRGWIVDSDQLDDLMDTLE